MSDEDRDEGAAAGDRDVVELALVIGRRALGRLRRIRGILRDQQDEDVSSRVWILLPFAMLRRRRVAARIGQLTVDVQQDLALLDRALATLQQQGLLVGVRPGGVATRARSRGSVDVLFGVMPDQWEASVHQVVATKNRVTVICDALRRLRKARADGGAAASEGAAPQ